MDHAERGRVKDDSGILKHVGCLCRDMTSKDNSLLGLVESGKRGRRMMVGFFFFGKDGGLAGALQFVVESGG